MLEDTHWRRKIKGNESALAPKLREGTDGYELNARRRSQPTDLLPDEQHAPHIREIACSETVNVRSAREIVRPELD